MKLPTDWKIQRNLATNLKTVRWGIHKAFESRLVIR